MPTNRKTAPTDLSSGPLPAPPLRAFISLCLVTLRIQSRFLSEPYAESKTIKTIVRFVVKIIDLVSTLALFGTSQGAVLFFALTNLCFGITELLTAVFELSHRQWMGEGYKSVKYSEYAACLSNFILAIAAFIMRSTIQRYYLEPKKNNTFVL